MSEAPDGKRLAALEERLAKARRAAEGEPDQSGAQETFSQAQMAWRMIIELVVGIGMGVGLGYGLDLLFGTMPWMLIVFTLLGFAAGIRVMLQSAREMGRLAQENADEDGAPAGDASDEEGRK